MAKKTKVTFEPVEDRLVVVRDAVEEVSPGGVILPELATDRPQQGTVLAVGPGRWVGSERQPMQVKVGDRVLFSAYAETVKLAEVDYVLLHESDVYSILR